MIAIMKMALGRSLRHKNGGQPNFILLPKIILNADKKKAHNRKLVLHST